MVASKIPGCPASSFNSYSFVYFWISCQASNVGIPDMDQGSRKIKQNRIVIVEPIVLDSLFNRNAKETSLHRQGIQEKVQRINVLLAITIWIPAFAGMSMLYC